MQYNKKPGNYSKNSKVVPSSKLLQALQKLLRNEGGSVSYVFVTERLSRKNFTNKQGEKDFTMEPSEVRSTLHNNISKEALMSNDPKRYGSLKTEEELLEMFQSTKVDLGASYFVLD